MTIQDLENQNLIIYKCISGSKAYGLDTPQSDTDYKGVFILPPEKYYTWNYVPQVADEKNDEVYYELGRFVELLSKNNPNLLEMLATDTDKILVKHPVMDMLTPDMFLSLKCKDTFAGYAMTQIRKARGLNKKIHNPMDKERKGLLQFCHVFRQQGTISLLQYLSEKKWVQEQCGLVKVPNMHNMYALFYDESDSLGFSGVVKRGSNSNMVALSSVPKDLEPVNYLHFNKDGYTRYCKDYKAYWDWVDKRNDARYENTISHGKNYDAKNMMHTFRLLAMAEEILATGKIIVHRPDREFLLGVRSGKYEYEDLIKMADERVERIHALAADNEKNQLPFEPDQEKILNTLFLIRNEIYRTHR